MHFVPRMKSIIGLLVAGLIVCVGAEGHARPHRHHRVAHVEHVAKRRANRVRHRARRAITREPPRRSEEDELVLSPPLMKQLQHNLTDGGYLDGTIDGRLTPRTRAALAGFQRDYHLPGNGALTRASAQALLGYDTIGTVTVASAPRVVPSARSTLRKRNSPQVVKLGG